MAIETAELIDTRDKERLQVLVEVLTEFVATISKGSMYAAPARHGMKYFARKCTELPDAVCKQYLDAVYQFADIARRDDIAGDDYRRSLVQYLLGLVGRG